MSLSLRRRVVKWSFGTILVLSASVVSAQRPLNMNDYDLRNQYGTMPGLNDQNPNQIQYGNIGGVVDNNAPQEADTTQKPPKIRKPLESYFFDDSTRSRQSFAWRVNLERNDVAIIEVDTALNGFQNDYPFLQNNVGSAMLGNMGGASVPLDFFLRPQYSDFTGFSMRHFAELFSDTRLIVILLETFMLAFLSALIATAIGTFGALSIYYVKKRQQRMALLSLNNILMVSPDVIIGASFLILFTAIGSFFGGIGLGFWTVLLSHVAFSIPIVVLMVLPKLQEMNESMVSAAYDLGANNFQVLKDIILPFLTPGIIAGYFMAFTYSLDDFAVTFFVTGNGFTTLAVEIYSRARRGVSLEINALSTLVFLFALVLVIGYYYISKDNKSKKKSERRQKGGVMR